MVVYIPQTYFWLSLYHKHIFGLLSIHSYIQFKVKYRCYNILSSAFCRVPWRRLFLSNAPLGCQGSFLLLISIPCLGALENQIFLRALRATAVLGLEESWGISQKGGDQEALVAD